MEQPQEPTGSFAPPSHETALCIIPPSQLWPQIDLVRASHDKGYDKWPPHINLIYPFVQPAQLRKAAEAIGQLDITQKSEGIQVGLERAGAFVHKRYNTVYLQADGDSMSSISHLRSSISQLLGKSFESSHHPHLTVAQSESPDSAPHKFLLEKARLLTPVHWHVTKLAILLRDSDLPDVDEHKRMRLWGYVDLITGEVTQESQLRLFYDSQPSGADGLDPQAESAQPRCSYRFNSTEGTWTFVANGANIATERGSTSIETLIVASYNVLAEFEWPPSSDRYAALIENITSARAKADILVLEEITDHFLPYLLSNEVIRNRFPYSTHAPPTQKGVGPLPSLLNVTVLSRYPLHWRYLPFQRRHKGAAIVEFPGLTHGLTRRSECPPLVLAACHLSQGLTDGAVVAKKNELQKILRYLSSVHTKQPVILAGDTNISTSAHTIKLARRKQTLTAQGQRYLRDLDTMLLEAGFQDSWLATRLEAGESSGMGSDPFLVDATYEGEQGATFDPLSNKLAADLVGVGFKCRPQRYDRILVNGHLTLRPSGFNLFGQENPASDHWGVRCLLAQRSSGSDTGSSPDQTQAISFCEAPINLGDVDELIACLRDHHHLPDQTDEESRKAALRILRTCLLSDARSVDTDGLVDPDLILTPVGSFGLGVWTRTSDVDCLCIGNISSRTFFTLAIQKLRKAASQGITILRQVQANSGTMLELDVSGVKFDLQYCSAFSITKSWPDVMKRPSSDASFSLPLQTLAKLKPARDLFYLKRSIPDMSQYRVAHLTIKAWAKGRGLYAAKFGFLGGINISALLVPVCKLLACSGRIFSAADILVSFFNHYASFDWKRQLVYDPFFHKDLKYHRTFREPLCLLGWHAPSLNTTMNASAPTMKTLETEFVRARELLDQANTTWAGFLGINTTNAQVTTAHPGASEFLQAYKSYVKIDAHYWGPSPSKGSKFLGWLESRCISILVDIDRKLPAMLARIWPSRFKEVQSVDCGQAGDQSEPDREFHGCYLIGLSWEQRSDDDQSEAVIRTAEGMLQTILREFEARMRVDEKYYDERYCWLSASIACKADMRALELDQSYWNDQNLARAGDSDDEIDFEEEEEEGEDDETASEVEGDFGQGFAGSKKRGPHAGKKGSSADLPVRIAKPPGSGRFRTAVDVMNRLRWDSMMDITDFLIGYEDRFLGPREKPLEQWKSEQTDEEFIPQHRILYFKRKSDGVIVWERKTWTDEIFGTGRGAAS